jgi:hypothetical protein
MEQLFHDQPLRLPGSDEFYHYPFVPEFEFIQLIFSTALQLQYTLRVARGYVFQILGADRERVEKSGSGVYVALLDFAAW